MKSKKMICKSIIIVMATLTFTFMALIEPSDSAPIKWRLQSNFPLNGPLYNPITIGIEKSIRDMSGGRLEIKTYPGGALVKSVDCLDAVSKNVVEMAIIPGGYFSGKIPVTGIEMGVPFTIETMLQLDYFFWHYGFIDIIRKAYADQGIYYVAPLCGVGNALISKKPVYNLDDLKKLKVRTAAMPAETLKEAGVSVVFVPGEEVYTSMSTGIIDACTWGAGVGHSELKTYEVAKYFVKKPMLCNIVVEGIFVNMKQWQKLPDDLKAILEAASRQVSAHRMRLYEVDEIRMLNKMVKEHGVKVIEWKDADIVPLQRAAMKVLDKYAEKDPKYSGPAAKMLKDYLKELDILK